MRVLIAEDSHIIALRTREILGDLSGVEQVAVVSSEEEAVAALVKSSPDLLVLDLRLSQGSGFGVLRTMQRSEAPITIVLSNFSDAVSRSRAIDLGADAFFDKSTEFDDLVSFVKLVASRYGSSTVGQKPAVKEV